MNGRRGLSAVLVAVALNACGGDPYPLHSLTDHNSVTAPAAIGEARDTVVIFIEVRPGDRIELLDAEPIGVAEGATVEFFFSPPVHEADGTTMIGERLLPLEGAIIEPISASAGPANTVGIVARLTAFRAGRFELSGVRLLYRLNGGRSDVREGIDASFTICADDPKPADCPEEASD